MKIIVIGGGWSGCAAALGRIQAGRGGRLDRAHRHAAGHGPCRRHHAQQRPPHGRRRAARHGRRGTLRAHRRNSLHREIEFPGHRHAYLYNVARMEPMVRIDSCCPRECTCTVETRITDVEMAEGRIRAVLARQGRGADAFEGRCFHRRHRNRRAGRPTATSTATAAPCASCAATPSAAA